MALATVLAGRISDVAISDWIHDLSPEHRERFGCRRCRPTFTVPSEATIRRTLQGLDGDAVDAVLRWIRRQSDSMTILIAYEAGPTGFGLARLCQRERIACEVIGPGLVPVRRRIVSKPIAETLASWSSICVLANSLRFICPRRSRRPFAI